MCLAHSLYAGCNNNMGIEVSWCDIKKLLTANCTLSQFLSMLCHYIRMYLGEEHMQRLLDMGGTGTAIICTPRDVIEPAKECPRFFRKKSCASDSDD